MRKASFFAILFTLGVFFFLNFPVAATNYTYHDLGTLGGPQPYSGANGINASGQVVGWTTVVSGQRHAFLYTPGDSMQDLGTLGGSYSQAYAVNASGQVVGYSYANSQNRARAFLYTPGPNGSMGSMQNLTLGGSQNEAYGINASGQVVGWSYTANDASAGAFIYTPGPNGGMQSLGTLGGGISYAYDINASGQVVGQSYTANNAAVHAFLYTPGPNGGMQSLGPWMVPPRPMPSTPAARWWENHNYQLCRTACLSLHPRRLHAGPGHPGGQFQPSL